MAPLTRGQFFDIRKCDFMRPDFCLTMSESVFLSANRQMRCLINRWFGHVCDYMVCVHTISTPRIPKEVRPFHVHTVRLVYKIVGNATERLSYDRSNLVFISSHTLRKLAHGIYGDFFKLEKLKIFCRKLLIFFLFLLKT